MYIHILYIHIKKLLESAAVAETAAPVLVLRLCLDVGDVHGAGVMRVAMRLCIIVLMHSILSGSVL